MRTPITYYGGKQILARRIVQMIPEHRVYCEPYFGGGAVFFTKKPSPVEAINDINDRLMTFYLQLQQNPEELLRMIKNTPHSEFISKYARNIYNGRVEGASDIELAWAVFQMTNGNFTGSPHSSWKWCNGTAGSDTGHVLARKRNRLSNALYERIKFTQISSRAALRTIRDRDSKRTVFFLDPPYPGANQKHYSGFTFNDLYDLVKLLSRIKGKFILTNYKNYVLKYFIAKYGWDVTTFTGHVVVNRIKPGQGSLFSTKKSEWVITNFTQPRSFQTKMEM